MSGDRRDLERELSRHLAEAAPAPQRDALTRLRARVGDTRQRSGPMVRLNEAFRSTAWTRLAAVAGVAAVALVVGIYIGQVGLPIQIGPSSSPSADVDPSAPPSGPQAWVEPEAYSYVLDSTCGERLLVGRFRITVAGGVVKDAESLLDPPTLPVALEEFPTLGDLLAELEEAQAAGAFVATLVSDPVDGHPVEIMIDHDEQAVDDEACYRISEYRPAGGEASPSPQPTTPSAPMTFAVWERFDMPDPARGVFGGGTPSSVTAFGGGYLAVGTRLNNCCAGEPSENDGLVWTSDDGREWQLVETGDTFVHATLHQVVVAGARLLATGWYGDPGVGGQVSAAWTSEDGVSWQRAPDPAPSWVVVADGVLVGAADSDSGSGLSVTFLRSEDGLTWFAADVQPELRRVDVVAVAPGGGALFIGSVDGRPLSDGTATFDVQAWRTTDGVTWTGHIAVENAHFRSLAPWGAGFLAVGSRPGELEGTAADLGTVWTSPDGLSWRLQDPGAQMDESILTGVHRISESLVAIAECCGGDDVLRPTAWVSEDGTTWSPVPHQAAFEGSGIEVESVIQTPEGLLAVGRRWDPESNHPLPQAWIASDEPMVWQLPSSQPGAEVGEERPFAMGHCGLRSPIDFDGSLWAPTDRDPWSLEFDSASGSITLLQPDRARFVSDAGDAVTLARLEGAAAYPLCG